MTETEAPKRRHRRTPEPARAPGLYLVGRFGETHDVTGDDWIGDVADADLAALRGYALLVLERSQRELERRATPVEIGNGFMTRQPDLRDLELNTGAGLAKALLQDEDTAEVVAESLGGWKRSDESGAVLEELPPEIAERVSKALNADPSEWVTFDRAERTAKRNSRKAAALAPEEFEPTAEVIPGPAAVFDKPEVIEETMGVKPGRPAMPWDND